VWYLLQLLVKPIMQLWLHFHPSCHSPAAAYHIHCITTIATLPPVTVQPCRCLLCCHHATCCACSVLLSVLPWCCVVVCCCLHHHSVTIRWLQVMPHVLLPVLLRWCCQAAGCHTAVCSCPYCCSVAVRQLGVMCVKFRIHRSKYEV